MITPQMKKIFWGMQPMGRNIYIYILIMAAVTYAVRVLPMTVIRRKIKNAFLRSFLYYVPYVTLSVMTFPAIIDAAGTPIAGVAALLVGCVAAWFGLGLFPVAVSCCGVVLISEIITMLCGG